MTVNITNTGTRSGDEVVLLFARTRDASVPSPRIRLVAFQRVRNIAPGTSVTVDLLVQPAFHAVVAETSESPYTPIVKVETGKLELILGPTWLRKSAAADAAVEITTTEKVDDCKSQ